MPFMLRTAAQRLGASSARRFGAVATQGGNSMKEFVTGVGLAGGIMGGVGLILAAFNAKKGTKDWVLSNAKH